MYIKDKKITQEFTRKTPRNKEKLTTQIKTRTVHVFCCDVCGKEFERPKGNVDKKRLSNDYTHTCSRSCSGKFTKNVVVERQRKSIMETTPLGTVRPWGEYPVIFIGFDPANNAKYTKNGGSNGWVREHTYVMESHLERKLTRGEVVHHIDGDKTNNSIENLHLMSVAEHNRCHAQSEHIVFELVKKGKVIFNKETERYELVGVDMKAQPTADDPFR